MNGFLDYLPLLLGGAAALGIFALLAKALQWLHNKLSYIAYFVVRPVPWFYDHGLEALKRRLHISAPRRLQAFGGPVRLTGVVLMVVATAVTLVHLYLQAENPTEFLIMDLLLAMPPFFPFTLVFTLATGSALFTVKSLVNSVLTSAFTIAFFHRHKDLPLVVEILYDLVFLLFFTAMPQLLPEGLYLLPGTLWQLLSDPSELLPFGTPRFLLIPFALLCFLGLVLCAYAVVAVFALAIRELTGNLAYSLMPFIAVAFLILPILEKVMAGTSDGWQTVAIVLLTLVMTVGLNYWRSESEEDPADDYPDYRPLAAKIAHKLSERRREKKEQSA